MGKASKGKMSKRVQGDMEELVKKHMASTGREITVRTNLPQEEKISNALSVMMTGEVSEDAPLLEYRNVLTLIVIAWNISLLDTQKRAVAMADLFGKKNFPDGNEEVNDFIKSLIMKKDVLFPNDKRTVVSCEAIQGPRSIGITAAAVGPSKSGGREISHN